ncbi:hypothetical protein [Nitrosomonas sp.]|uniref:hypothetical protein n=1 Tax=Nitrosomonas sp. TaxID=42353 RepID=UPI002841C838|nr:hypothetical protein [Nitrosomonas sp.]MDR4515039.1 hypothetical protein [Nitrosomonas sp.]
MDPQESNTESSRQNNGDKLKDETVTENSASAAFQVKYLIRDVQAGIITGAMAIPLSVGIAIMSDYPIKVALATVVFACFWVGSTPGLGPVNLFAHLV